MKTIQSMAQMLRLSREVPRPLGLVPTMGALHQGHMSLVHQARRDNATLVVSIFVNPTQFGPHEDLAAYPRNLELDVAHLAEAGTDLVLAPPVEDVYPSGFGTWVEVERLSQRLEGGHRPGHFRGVTTVVAKVFNAVRPDRAYFGQKDWQQSAIIKRLAADLNMGVEVVVLPTARESDGLACSSRNAYLSPPQRAAAPVVYQSLLAGEALWRRGESDATAIKNEVNRVLLAEPLVQVVDYISLADSETLEELKEARPGAMLLIAARIGAVRLIDNVVLA